MACEIKLALGIAAVVLTPSLMLAALVLIERTPSPTSTLHKMELIGFNRPKHVYVDMQELATGKVYRGVYVSKHCNNWRSHAVIGRRFHARRDTWESADGDQNSRWSSEYLYSVFCG